MMDLYADLHIHSRYARATSKDLNLENLEKYARVKGLGLLGTGDFQHPKWQQEVREKLSEEGDGILRSKSGFPFIWQTEIAVVYTQGGRGRRIHHIILAPNADVVTQITDFLKRKGRVDYDGRPIFGFSSIELVDSMMSISEDIEIIPAHAWTPWFGVFGGMSGFDSLKECFGDRADKIHAIETGLSSDPPMNWRIRELDRVTLLSNSDCHSFWPWRIGREANIFELPELSYKGIIRAIRNRSVKGTIEVDPAYGKYHFDGHRACGVCLSPAESLKNMDICPKCRRRLTIGVLHRVEQLADRPAGEKPDGAAGFFSVIPLSEIIGMVQRCPVASAKTWKVYNQLIEAFGNEYALLLDMPQEELAKACGGKLADAIMMNRDGRLKVEPGYDGEYGVPRWGDERRKVETEKPAHSQRTLGMF
ncbi:DNA helicase UvrD [Candidatus Woesearchaeota archaeon]|nr:DNA helicase UvrD [Candidatus Woesearchaeota archaeon]